MLGIKTKQNKKQKTKTNTKSKQNKTITSNKTKQPLVFNPPINPLLIPREGGC